MLKKKLRRMVTIRANGIGIWFKILATLSSFSVLTNVILKKELL